MMLGKHCLLNIQGARKDRLDDLTFLTKLLRDAAVETGATVLDSCSKKFEPQGVTIVILLSESHISIHTWPERGSALIDIFTCGDDVDPFWAVPVINSGLEPERFTVEMINR
jgi:S-adenosylmethionine decarboxylase proenzyme